MARKTLTIDSFPDGGLPPPGRGCHRLHRRDARDHDPGDGGDPGPTRLRGGDREQRPRAGASLPGACLMGTAGGERPPGFALADSPYRAPARARDTARCVLWSPPGTELIANASRCRSVWWRRFATSPPPHAGSRATTTSPARRRLPRGVQLRGPDGGGVGRRAPAREGFEPGDRRTAALAPALERHRPRPRRLGQQRGGSAARAAADEDLGLRAAPRRRRGPGLRVRERARGGRRCGRRAEAASAGEAPREGGWAR